MYEIVAKSLIAPEIKLFRVRAPLVAEKAKPGNFVVVRVDERGERIPLTIADWDPSEGTITLVVQEVGVTTLKLGKLDVGDSLLNCIGPLGNPSRIERFGTVVCVGGGVGIPPVYPIARALKKVGNHVISIIGAKTADLLIFERGMREASDEIFITTDDGSYGRRGFVSGVLAELLSQRRIDRVIAIGPAIMMKVVAEATRPYKIETIASLNSIMVDGTGMCGACRVSVGGETKFTCVDGPEFDAHQVDFDLLMARLNMYKDKEQEALTAYREGR